MTDHDALLMAILSTPAADTPRLMYADWLDEHGEPDRAGFIRVQCELARLSALPSTAEAVRGERQERCDCGPDFRTGGRCERCLIRQDRESVPALRRRERELLKQYVGRRWKHELGFWVIVSGSPPASGPFGVASRGFVSAITCTAEDWLRVESAVYWHPGQAVQVEREVDQSAGGTHRFRQTVPRPFVATAQPLERVILTTQMSAGVGIWTRLSRTPSEWTCDRWPGITFVQDATHGGPMDSPPPPVGRAEPFGSAAGPSRSGH